MPGTINLLWFEAKEEGEFDIVCVQYCGTYYYKMKGKFTIMKCADFDVWIQEVSKLVVLVFNFDDLEV